MLEDETNPVPKAKPFSKRNTCQTLDLDPHSQGARYWGHETPCLKAHVDKPDYMHHRLNLDRILWLRIGHDTDPRSCSEWHHKENQEDNDRKHENELNADGRYEEEVRDDGSWMTTMSEESFNLFLRSIGITIQQCASLLFKVPGIETLHHIYSKFEWIEFMRCLELHQRRNHNMWCKSTPPVILICTHEQAARCQRRGWLDSVRFERAIYMRPQTDAIEMLWELSGWM